ncbi:MAG: hypothetical protein ACTHN3_06850 [Solirubrobacterales bacterium]
MIMAVLSGLAPQSALGSEGPAISEVGSHSNGNNWVLSATVDPGSEATEYEFWLRTPGCASCAPYSEEVVGSGVVPGEAGPVQKNVELIEPEYGIFYAYWVVASSAAGFAESAKGYFTPPLPLPENEPTPYEMTLPSWAVEGIARGVEERTRQEQEQRAREEAATVQHCAVPRLRGDTVAEARHALRQDDCWLGTVHHSRPLHRGLHSRGRQVVIGQSQPAGLQLPAHTEIGVRLGLSNVRG